MVEVEEGDIASLLIIVTGMLESDNLIQNLISVDVMEGEATEGSSLVSVHFYALCMHS